MKRTLFKQLFFIIFLFLPVGVSAWEGMSMPKLHVDGRYFKDEQGNIVNLHGFAQTYSPWFNEQGTKWTNYDVSACLSYNKGLIDKIGNAGWKMSFIRLHMDPYWSNNPGQSTTGENDISAFKFDRFKTYLNSVFIPMAKYAISKGLYVVMRPPGVCPEKIVLGDAYQQYLIKVWGYVSQQPDLKNNPNIMFELANEPVGIYNTDGSSAGFKELKQYFQAVVDTMRKSCDNILLIPGLAYQANYAGFAENPVEGDNIGYAVHCYPGWYNSGSESNVDVTYDKFKTGWDNQIKPVSDFAPIIVTEMDWALKKYNSSWGKGITGVAGGTGFGANFKKIADESGNVSWLIFTSAELLAQFKDEAPASSSDYTFLTDPEACPWPTYHWYQDYAKVEYPRSSFTFRPTSDNGDGTFTNPVIQADFPDPDVVKVGDTYYMVTTTMHNFPGCTLLKSKDLINWEYCCNPLTKMSSNAEYNLEDNSNIYSKGSWANSLMYKNGTFYIMFNAFGKGDDAGGYLLSATDPEGTWTMTRLSRGYYDPGMLLDNDGNVYVVCGNKNLSVVQLDNDFKPVKEVAVDGGFDGLEGSHFFKKDGYYYIYSTCCAWPATQWCFRSTNVFGPYEKKKVFDSDDIHQGQMIQTQSGEWWTMLMRDCGAYGRMPYLLPVTWTDNWPVIGKDGKDAGTYTKPNVGKSYEKTYLPTNDNFRDYKLGMQWQWNHNPDNSKWSLFDRPGYLRLYTANVTDSMQKARNTLTQRIYGFHNATSPSYGTVKMDIRNMKDGDVAGLTVFQNPYAFIGVSKSGSTLNVIQRNTVDKKNYSTAISCDSIYLRAIANIGTSKVSFFYSTDNINYTPFGQSLDMKYDLSVFVGNRFCLFNYATSATGGYVDIDWFTTESDFTENMFYDDTFTAYSADYLTCTGIAADKTSYSLLKGAGKSFNITATYKDGHTADITTDATYSVDNENIVKIVNGRFSTQAEGSTIVTANYKDATGNVFSLDIPISVSLFPLSADVFNPSIYETGTFDETTGSLITGKWGFGGWQYSSALDLSAYKYVVVQLSSAQSCGASFRMFDETSYWSTPVQMDLGTNTTIKIDLQNSKKGTTTTAFNPAHIYIVGFWSYGGGVIKIKSVFVSNDGYNPITSVKPIYSSEDDELVNVYNMQGMLIRSKIKNSDIQSTLSKGVYIINNKCKVIR